MILLFGSSVPLFAQKKMGIAVEPSMFKDAEYLVFFTQFDQDNVRDQIRGFLEGNLLPPSSRQSSGLVADGQIKRITSQHFRFRQTVAGYPVYRSEAKASWYPGRSKLLVFSNVYHTENWNLSQLVSEAQFFSYLNTNELLASFNFSEESEIEVRTVVFKTEDKIHPQIALEAKVYDPATHRWEEMLFDSQLNVLQINDLNAYRFSADTVVGCKVFNPDPVTTAAVQYGVPYIDNNDNEVQVLNAERVWLTTVVDKSGGQYLLQNNWVRIREFNNPNVQPASSSQPQFDFTI